MTTDLWTIRTFSSNRMFSFKAEGSMYEILGVVARLRMTQQE